MNHDADDHYQEEEQESFDCQPLIVMLDSLSHDSIERRDVHQNKEQSEDDGNHQQSRKHAAIVGIRFVRTQCELHDLALIVGFSVTETANALTVVAEATVGTIVGFFRHFFVKTKKWKMFFV